MMELVRFQRGDIADTAEACVCLIATEGPLRFKGLLPRLLQPIFRM